MVDSHRVDSKALSERDRASETMRLRPRSEIAREILFRLCVVYSVAAAVFVVAVIGGAPWGREYHPDDRASPTNDANCRFVPSKEAARAAHDARETAARLPEKESGGLAAKLGMLPPGRSQHLKCADYYDRLAEWHSQLLPNFLAASWWQTILGMGLIFIGPAWLLWAIVRWAIIGPLLS